MHEEAAAWSKKTIFRCNINNTVDQIFAAGGWGFYIQPDGLLRPEDKARISTIDSFGNRETVNPIIDGEGKDLGRGETKSHNWQLSDWWERLFDRHRAAKSQKRLTHVKFRLEMR